MAGEELDELFGQAGTGQPEARTPLVIFLLVFGLLTALGGLACTSAPGGIMVLLAWVLIEREVDRIDSGYLPLDEKPRLLRIQLGVQIGLVFIILLFVVQAFLYCNGFYDILWGSMVDVVRPLLPGG